MTIEKQNRVYRIAFVIAVLLLLSDCVFLTWFLIWRHEQVLVRKDRTELEIFIEPDDTATRAAAEYLAFEIDRRLGVEPGIVTSREEGGKYISILCEESAASGEEMAEETPALAAPVVAAATDLPGYSLKWVKGGLEVSVPRREDCFGAVKAVTDRWLQEDCGLKKAGELRISRAMIRETLSDLSTVVPEEIRILTQNLRNADDGDGNNVEERAVRFFQQVELCRPDLIGTQECTPQWKTLLQENLGDRYAFFGCSTNGPTAENGEWNAILYREERFLLQDGGTFWLSNTPQVPASKLNYDGPYRICTWALLTDTETGKQFFCANTHLNHNDSEFYRELRARQAEILMRTLRGNSGDPEVMPGFLIGDFNGETYEPFYAQVTSSYRDAAGDAITDSSPVHYSFHGYGAEQWMIDFCFHSPQSVTVLDYHILSDVVEGYVSDHYGVLVTAVVN